MRRVKLGILVAIPSLFVLTPQTLLAADAACPTRVGVEATISAVEGREGVYRLRAEAKDLATGNLLPSPQVFFRRAEEGAANSSLPGGGEIRYTVLVEDSKAVFKVETQCNNELTASQKITINLPK